MAGNTTDTLEGSRIQTDRARGTKTDRIDADTTVKRLEKGGGVGSGKAMGGYATDNLSVEVGYGAIGRTTITVRGEEYVLSPFTFLHLETAAIHIANIPLLLMALSLQVSHNNTSAVDIDKVAMIMNYLQPQGEFNADAVRLGLPTVLYSIRADQITSLVELLRFSLYGFYEDRVDSGEIDDLWVRRWLTIERAVEFLRKMFEVNMGVYDRFLQGFEGSPPPVAVLPVLRSPEQESQFLAESEIADDDSDETQS